MPLRQPVRVRLRVSIAFAAALIVVLLTVAIVGFLFLRNRQAALSIAQGQMGQATAALIDHLNGLLEPVARVVDATAVLAQIDRSGLHRIETLRYFLASLETLPQADSLYIGFASDGTFYEVLRVNPNIDLLGQGHKRPPASARYALRLLDASSGERADSFIYVARWGEVVGVDRGPATYDPRERPWYRAAWARPGTTASEAYIFATSSKPGITLSHRIATDDGIAIGTVGADVSFEVLTQFVERERIGQNGIVFIVDDQNRLIAYPQSSSRPDTGRLDLQLSDVAQAQDPRIVAAARQHERDGLDKFNAIIDGESYLMSFTPFDQQFGHRWLIGAIVPEDDFVGPLRRSSLHMLGFAALALALSLLGVLFGSKLLTRPIDAIIAETKRIRQFDLGGTFNLKSPIIEVDDLASSISAMKSGLQSFAAYVPKTLVRTIVMSGRGIEIGGERRALTILFTDIRDFTRRSEAMAPEAVLTLLSRYLEALSHCIQDHGGTIDKFIGDSVMAFWNAPLDDADHAINACRALLACHAATETLNADFQGKALEPLFTRFGLHTGEVVVGNVGSMERTQYTALGDAVNLASRIEGLNKYYGTQMLVTGAVERFARDQFLFRGIDTVVPSGTSRPVELFELLAATDGKTHDTRSARFPWLNDWNAAVSEFRLRDWQHALELFQLFKALRPEDQVVDVYIDRCKEFLARPPPSDWDGAEHYDRK
jgi:adenylate cyclase